jgi:hypothetical protein
LARVRALGAAVTAFPKIPLQKLYDLMDKSPDAVNHGVMTVAMMMRAPNGAAGRLAHRIAYPIDASRLS